MTKIGAANAVDALRGLDGALRNLGQSTAAIARLFSSGSVDGASAGDSEVWVRSDGWLELSKDQHAKPLLGSGATPVPFGHAAVTELLMCSDGLSKYTKWARVLATLDEGDAEFPWRIIDAARLPSGNLQDDVSVLHVRRL